MKGKLVLKVNREKNERTGKETARMEEKSIFRGSGREAGKERREEQGAIGELET